MLAGSLDDFGISELFSLLENSRKTGTLSVTGSDRQGLVWFREGRIAFAVGDTTRVPFASRLLHEGYARPGQLEWLLRKTGQEMAEGLVGFARDDLEVDEGDLAQMVQEQSIDGVFELLRAEGDEFTFQSAVPSRTDLPSFGVADVLTAAQDRVAAWTELVATVPSTAAVPRLAARPPTTDGLVSVTADQWDLLRLLDGSRTVDDLIEQAGRGSYGVLRVLAGMIQSGLVDVDEATPEATPAVSAVPRPAADGTSAKPGSTPADPPSRPAHRPSAVQEVPAAPPAGTSPAAKEDREAAASVASRAEAAARNVSQAADHAARSGRVDRANVARELAALNLDDDTDPPAADASVSKSLISRLANGVSKS